MRADASPTISRAIFSSTVPAPAASVSARCFSTESPGDIAAAMPPCAHAEDAPCPIGAAASTVTGRGASRSAQNRPASPPPRMITSSATEGAVAGILSVMSLIHAHIVRMHSAPPSSSMMTMVCAADAVRGPPRPWIVLPHRAFRVSG